MFAKLNNDAKASLIPRFKLIEGKVGDVFVKKVRGSAAYVHLDVVTFMC